MKINGNSISGLNGRITTGGKAPAAATAASAPASGADAIQLSGGAKALHALDAATAPFDADKVDSIKAAISAGTFQINPGAIADGLISSVSELLARK